MGFRKYLIKKHPDLVEQLLTIPSISYWLSESKINEYAKCSQPRPRSLSLASDYTSWYSLTNKAFTGRHLPPDEVERIWPDIETVAHLWARIDDKEIPSMDTSLTFAFFAQWFTDSFLRTDLSDTRKNMSNHEIDFCQLYGSNENQTHILRSHQKGELRYQMISGEVFPPYLFDREKTTYKKWVFAEPEFEKMHNLERLKANFPPGRANEERLKHMFLTGLEHGNSNIGYSLMNTIALREHNRIAKLLANEYPDWDDERLFQTARMVSIVCWLRIILNDYVTHIASYPMKFNVRPDFAEKQNWYRNNWISLEFNLLYRWHSMVPEKLIVGDREFDHREYRSNPQLLVELGVENLLNAASRQTAGKIGLRNTASFFFYPINWPNSDEKMSIQARALKMARDAKLRPYNDYREDFGLSRLKSFAALTDDVELQNELKSLYGDIDNLEWFVGVYCEKHQTGQMMGELMLRMVAYDAFTHAFTNPLLSKNVFNEKTFSPLGMQIISETTTLQDIVSRNTRKEQHALGCFASVKEVPGTYGIPLVSKIYRSYDFFIRSGWKNYLNKRAEKYGSTVFKTHSIEPVVMILDPVAIEQFVDWNEKLKKEHRFGLAKPPRSLTGYTRPMVFENGEKHALYKSFLQNILQKKSQDFFQSFEAVYTEHSSHWVDEDTLYLSDSIENMCISFAFRWMFDIDIDAENARLIYNNIFYHFLEPITDWLPWSKLGRSKRAYEKLRQQVRASDAFTEYMREARHMDVITEDELLDQLIFVTGMNIYLGLQNLSKSLVGELSRQKDETARLIHAASDKKEFSRLLDRFVKETLRLHPPVFTYFGRADCDFILNSSSGQFQIRKYDQVMAFVPFAQVDYAHTREPEKFDPDRFAREDAPNLFWSHGLHDQIVEPHDHACPGKDFVVQYAKMFVECLLTDYVWELEEPPEWDTHKYSLNMAAPMGKMKVKYFEKRGKIASPSGSDKIRQSSHL